MNRYRIVAATGALLLVCAGVLGQAASAQTPAPSPSGSGVASPSVSPTASGDATPTQEAIAVLVAAEPAIVDVGEETLLVAQVTNTGTAPLTATTLEIVLPAELEHVSAFPVPASSTGAVHTFALGSLDPGESAVVQVTAVGAAAASGAVVAATATAGAATATDSATVSVVEGGGDGTLVVSSRARRMLTQVGSMVRYEVTVSNRGDGDLENVLVVDVAPEEIDVVSVDIVDEVEAVQIGESRGRHDIVWNVGSLPAGRSIELPWDGRATEAGDLRAVNSVRGLVGTTETTRSSTESFLAAEGPRDVDNPPFDPIEDKVVTFEDPPPATPAPRAATLAATQPQTQAETVLPFTGSSPARLVWAGTLLVLGGALLVAGTRLAGSESRKALGAAVLAGLVCAACVSGGDDPVQEAAPGASAAPATEDPRDGEDGDARVKGERIVRGRDSEDETATPVPTAPPAASPAPTAPAPIATAPPLVAAPVPSPVDPEPIRVVEIVRTGLEDLPVETLGSRPGDNTITFGWDEAAGGITSASSGTRFVRGRGSDLLTDLSTAGGAIVNRMTLRNTHEAVRLHVQGRLVHEVYEGDRLVARLRSEPIDVVLSPGGEVAARFSYLLPAGQYTVEAAFESQ